MFVAADLDPKKMERAVQCLIMPVARINQHSVHIEDYSLDFIAHEKSFLPGQENRCKVTRSLLNANPLFSVPPIISDVVFCAVRAKQCKPACLFLPIH